MGKAESHAQGFTKKKIVPLLRAVTFTDKRRKEIKELFLEELYQQEGQPYLALKELFLVAPRTIYEWREKDKRFAEEWDQIVEFVRATQREMLIALSFQLLSGKKKLHPAAYTLLIFNLKAICDYSDQPNGGVTNIHVDMPSWLMDKVNARKPKSELRTTNPVADCDK
jgi:hypothetical protein